MAPQSQHAAEQMKSDERASQQSESELDLPALSPQPDIGSVLEANEQQPSVERTLSEEPPLLYRPPPHQSPPVEVQQSRYSAISLGPHQQRSQAQHFGQPQSVATHHAAHTHHSAYTYNQFHHQPQPHSSPHSSPHQRHPVVPLGGQPTYQPLSASLSANHHPSVAYYHGASEALPAHVRHADPAHAYQYRRELLLAQCAEVQRSWEQVQATQHTRSQHEHALLVRHHEHHLQQLCMELDSTNWMLHGNSLLSTAADMPSIHSYAHAAQRAQQQQQQQQHEQRAEGEEEQDEEEESEYSEDDLAEVEALLGQTYDDSNTAQDKKRKQSNRAHAEGEQQEESKTGEKAPRKQRATKKQKRDPNRPAHPISAYIVSHTHIPSHSPLLRCCDSKAFRLHCCVLCVWLRQFFHMERMKEWQRINPDAHTNAAEQGKLSGAQWRLMSDEQKQPYIEQAQHDKQLKQPYTAPRRPGTASSSSRAEEKQAGAGDGVDTGTEARGEQKAEGERSAARSDKKEALDQVAAVESEFSELSPALSPRRPSDPFVQALDAEVEPAVHLSPAATSVAVKGPPRPASAMQLYINDRIERLQDEARGRSERLLKGDARKIARTDWDQLTATEKDVAHIAAHHWYALALATAMRVCSLEPALFCFAVHRAGGSCMTALWRVGSTTCSQPRCSSRPPPPVCSREWAILAATTEWRSRRRRRRA